MHNRYGAGEVHLNGRAEVAFRRSNIGGKARVISVFFFSRTLDHDVIRVPRAVKFKRKPPVGSFNVIAFNINHADAVARSKRSVVGKRIDLVKCIARKDGAGVDGNRFDVGEAVERQSAAADIHHDGGFLRFARFRIDSGKDAAVVAHGKVGVGFVIVDGHVACGMLDAEIERCEIVVRICTHGQKDGFILRIPIGEDVAR